MVVCALKFEHDYTPFSVGESDRNVSMSASGRTDVAGSLDLEAMCIYMYMYGSYDIWFAHLCQCIIHSSLFLIKYARHVNRMCMHDELMH